VVEIKSERAQKLLQNPHAIVSNDLSLMKKYPSDEFSLWVHVELDNQNVKKLSFAGTLEDYEKVLLEATASLMKGKSLAFFENLTLRECEAFLRDRNSELAVVNLTAADESKFHKFFQWLRVVRPLEAPQDYHFSLKKGPFRDLKLVDKVKELKAFLNSVEIQDLYAGLATPELVDVDDLSVYIQAPYHSEKDRALFEGLHALGVATFQEESLNFIPEA
jgi:site-specific recombinase XerD